MPLFDKLLIHLGVQKASRPNRLEARKEEGDSVSYKWVPVISQDYCTGCAKCVNACEHECLGMVWDYPVLQRPADCHSDGACVDACPEECMRMDWVPTTGDQRLGFWSEGRPTEPPY